MASSTRDRRLKRIQELLDGMGPSPIADLPEDPGLQVLIGGAALCASAAVWAAGCISRLEARRRCIGQFSDIDRSLWHQAFAEARQKQQATTDPARLSLQRRNLEDLINAVAAGQAQAH